MDQPPQGLVVDVEVTSPLYPNFYLQSHAGMLGSESVGSANIEYMDSPISSSARKSSHYTILHNENESFDADL